MTTQWVLGYRKSTPEKMAEALIEAMPSELTKIFREIKLI